MPSGQPEPRKVEDESGEIEEAGTDQTDAVVPHVVDGVDQVVSIAPLPADDLPMQATVGSEDCRRPPDKDTGPDPVCPVPPSRDLEQIPCVDEESLEVDHERIERSMTGDSAPTPRPGRIGEEERSALRFDRENKQDRQDEKKCSYSRWINAGTTALHYPLSPSSESFQRK